MKKGLFSPPSLCFAPFLGSGLSFALSPRTFGVRSYFPCETSTGNARCHRFFLPPRGVSLVLAAVASLFSLRLFSPETCHRHAFFPEPSRCSGFWCPCFIGEKVLCFFLRPPTAPSRVLASIRSSCLDPGPPGFLCRFFFFVGERAKLERLFS